MNRILMAVTITLLVAPGAFAANGAWTGQISDSMCGLSHKAMIEHGGGNDPAVVLPGQTVGEFHLVQEGLVRPMRAQRSLISAEQVPFDRIEQLARETKGQDEKQLRLFGNRRRCDFRRAGLPNKASADAVAQHSARQDPNKKSVAGRDACKTRCNGHYFTIQF